MGFGYIHKMRGYFLISILLFLFIGVSSAFAATITSTGTGGNWSATTTWVGGVVPTSVDDVVIADGATTTVDASFGGTINALTVGGGVSGSVLLSRGLTTNAGIAVASGATLDLNGQDLLCNAGLTITGTTNFGTSINIAMGALTVNGIANFQSSTVSVNSTLTVNTGATFNASTGTILIEDGTTGIIKSAINIGFNNLTLNTSTFGGNGLTFDETTALANPVYTINGTLAIQNHGSGSTPVSVINGAVLQYNQTTSTLSYQKYTKAVGDEWPPIVGPANVSISSGVDRTLSKTVATVPGNVTVTGTFTLDNAINLTVSGLITVNGGTFNANKSGANANTINANGGATISSGTLDASNGTLNIATTKTLTLSGGTLNVTGGALSILGSATFSKGAGTLTLGTLTYGTTATLNYTATVTSTGEWEATVPNVTISSGTVSIAATSGTRTITNVLTVTSTLTANDNAINCGTLTDNGAMTTTNVAVAATGNASFGSSATLNTGGGNFSAGGTLTLGSSAGLTTAGGTVSVTGTSTINGSATISTTAGSVSLTGDVSMDFGSAISATGTVTMSGSLTVNGGATVGTSTAGTLVMGGASTATVNIDGSLTLFNFTVNKTGGASTIVTPSVSVDFKFNTNGTLYVQQGVLQLTSASTFKNAGGALISASDNITLKIDATGTLKTADVPITGFNVFTLADNSTIDFTGTIAQDIPAATYGNITVSTTHTNGATLAGAVTLQTNSTVTVSASSRLNLNGKVITHPGTNADDLTVASGGVLYTNGSSILGFSTYSSLAGTVVFNGTSQETMPAATFTTVTVNNSGGVALGGAATVTGTLTFTNGTVTSTSTNLLTLGVSATATPTSSTFVLGPVARQTNGSATTFAFPVGIGTDLRKVSLSFTGVAPATANTITVEAKGTTSLAASADPDVKTVETDGYWTISSTLGTVPNYTGTFTTTNFSPAILSSSNVTMVKGTNPNFDTQGTLQSSNTDLVTASFTTSFGDFAVGNLTSTYTWTGTTNNNWSVGTNWDLGSAPGNGDVISIPTAKTVLYDAGVTTTNYSSVTLAGSATLSLDATTFDFSGTSFTLGSTGTLTFNGATILNYNGANTTYPTGSTVQFNTGTVQADAYDKLIVNNAGAVASSGTITVAGTFTKSGAGTYTASGAVSVTGAVTLSAGTIDPSGGFTASGNIAGNGGQFSGASGTVTLNGSTQQTISGTTGLTFNNLTLNNASGLAISTGPTVEGVLTMTAGLITTGSNNLTIGTAGSITGASATRYVSGRLAKVYPTGAPTFTYPTGKGGEYLPLTLTFSSLTSGYTRVVEQINSDANVKSSTLDASLSKVSIVRYWEVSRVGTSGGIGGNITMKLTYNANDGVDVSATKLDVAQLSDGNGGTLDTWYSIGGNGTALTAGTITSSAFITGGNFYTFGDASGAGADNSLPVELSAFEATPDFDQVNFSWTTSSELKNLGFNLYRKGSENTDWVTVNAEIIPGKGTYSAETQYSYTDKNVVAGHTYSYKLESISYDGAVTVEKIIKIDVPVPQEYALFKNYPNPFNPTTHIKFQVPEYSTVTVVIYDISGREVKTLINKTGYDAGKYDVTWNATDNFESKVASGMYFYRFSAGSFNKMGRMILLK